MLIITSSSNNRIKPHRRKRTVLVDCQMPNEPFFTREKASTVRLRRCGFDGLCEYCCR